MQTNAHFKYMYVYYIKYTDYSTTYRRNFLLRYLTKLEKYNSLSWQRLTYSVIAKICCSVYIKSVLEKRVHSVRKKLLLKII